MSKSRCLSVLFAAAASSAAMAQGAQQRCEALAADAPAGWRIAQATFHAAAAPAEVRLPPALVRKFDLPAHCEIVAATPDRPGANGQVYAVRLHLRMPVQWNDRWVFQGGGGSNGDLGDAFGVLDAEGRTAVEQGYAVLSQDSGHDNARNADPLHNGELAFGFDPVARADYGHASLAPSARAALGLLERFYGRAPRYRYFVGCSKGGQEGMMFAQRHPEIFDGIVAAAPGMSLPRAALAQAWDTQSFGRLLQKMSPDGRFDAARLPDTFNRAQLGRVRQAVLEACDADDGLRDGIVGDVKACTDAKVRAQLAKAVCSASAAASDCLRPEQVEALEASVAGPRDAQGRTLYARWFWPSGIDSDGWRVWKIGLEGNVVPALNVVLGARALASVMTTPPVALPPDPQGMASYQMSFDFTRDAGRIDAVVPPFERSAWQDIGARSSDLSAFARRGGKLLVPHGESDAVFSLADTLDWYGEVDRRAHGRAASFVRVFPVPGMAHCGGGPATDTYDALGALVRWVEQGQAPERIEARAGAASPWPGRTRPLCPYPKVARYLGHGDVESAKNFSCVAPKARASSATR